jgi:hypothetical protein
LTWSKLFDWYESYPGIGVVGALPGKLWQVYFTDPSPCNKPSGLADGTFVRTA